MYHLCIITVSGRVIHFLHISRQLLYFIPVPGNIQVKAQIKPFGFHHIPDINPEFPTIIADFSGVKIVDSAKTGGRRYFHIRLQQIICHLIVNIRRQHQIIFP